ncbi:F0F1 ATP synthase subunit epsilon [Flavobacterium psychrophilum]|jgi:F-type H+-transporting ATPase subunit epsilon|uniref:ATP synthase epsilon subunit n=2 Tax=Flavobacterium psychrophilum TaxID=96345 RepID=A6GVW0_FLAPJ|nr:F0F1 ATP synthase subunit epsilon [Flavobacterium psychrophilum]AIG29063.1 ATP synthase subunit delta [Flavobacterium psychrophilum]AIG31339.1 ATP synthase subunit delta [Flavobacterium psychrophilum]AIG35759.1 ATP synthase subunit delta [Flavobacterium psychrophilum]AIG35865.1 ATP synthase subunit delta [Flavobacterium psychrophilum]AIG38120.1 ATP synthase subunit delta [Flavobacterium psychrophilum]
MILEIVSPEASLFKGEITSISVPGVDGSFEMLNNHAPIVSLLQKGTVRITAPSFKFSKESDDLFTRVNDQNYTLAISSGTLEMKDNKVIVLVD